MTMIMWLAAARFDNCKRENTRKLYAFFVENAQKQGMLLVKNQIDKPLFFA